MWFIFFDVNFFLKDLNFISGLICFSLCIAVEDFFFLISLFVKIIWRARLDISTLS